MTKLSKLKLDPEDFGHYVNNLWSAFTLMDTKEDIRLLFRDLFTHTEYKMFAKRLEIARRLIAGQTYEEIKKSLNVTATTISNVNNILSEKGGGYRKVHDKLIIIEKSRQVAQDKRQNQLERHGRKKLSSETFVFDLAVEGFKAASKKIQKTIKEKSVSHELTL
ncbi:MAG: hypothetical protein A3B10_03240 [Candidatus Doudnabacteria bacterium RIFCSPLOWO2_01_FULL_44_21]|uniref:TrpR like protein, YerC/YecD n=1 Tax=Candidatus Doudnabacteria bacterium RIFCSPLOWO2_01_FULL_44_21 TaxID=1817841 RepID=A0A1F5PXW3_9BACT|nr:MAG: hypothetical protein A3B95_02610 [Candidatus Doudnabacteria bacterium RIFCSPHIGHO2_02_FULL_43_13b]OGE94781.1 MAG: hypothetical protein A3B10_03240 [Candidatus Doudnabacteria bacterium RIFCSPLOWO2_01_FULL_44_21]